MEHDLSSCIEACTATAKTSHACANHCREMGHMKDSVSLMEQCAHQCEKTVSAMKSGSHEHCLECAEACAKCAKECEKHEDDKMMTECAVACRQSEDLSRVCGVGLKDPCKLVVCFAVF